MVVRIRVTEERLYDIVAETPQEAESIVSQNWLGGHIAHEGQARHSIEKRGLPQLTVRAINPRIPRAVRRAAKAQRGKS